MNFSFDQEFAMKRAVWILGAVVAAAILFGADFLVGRQFPAHHYQRLSDAPAFMLFDTATGKPCMARRVTETVPRTTSPTDLEKFTSSALNVAPATRDEKDLYPDVPTCGAH